MRPEGEPGASLPGRLGISDSGRDRSGPSGWVPMLWILVSSRTERERFLHREGRSNSVAVPSAKCPGECCKTRPSPPISFTSSAAGKPVQLRNLSAKVTIRLADGSLIDPGRELLASLPARLQIGDTLIEIESQRSRCVGGRCRLL